MSGVVLAPETTMSVVSPQHANPKRTDDASTLVEDLLGVSLVPEITVQSVPDATSPPSIDQEVSSVFHPVPFRFSFDPPSDPASVSAFVKAYPNLLGYHMWSSWDRLTAVSTYGPPGSDEEDEPDSGWDFSGLGNPSAMRDFMTACDYCLSDCSDDGHSLDDEGCGPSRECFHIDLRGHDEDNHLGTPEDDDPPRSIAQLLPDSCGRPRSTPGARGTRRLQPRVASATSTTVATIEPALTRRCAEATTPGVGDATTVRRIGAPRPNHQVRKPSAGPYDGRRSRLGSEPRLPSLSTRGKQGRSCGLRTTGWPASWVERTMITSSSATSPCSSPTPPEPGWSICLLRKSPTGTT
jgi:hypothetical protein